MSWNYDTSTDIGKVRALITDTDANRPLMDDEEIQVYLDLESGDVKLAAALCLEGISTNELLCSKVVTIMGLTVDGAQVAKQLLARAKTLRESAVSTGGFLSIELADDPYQRREKFWKEVQRGNL